MALNGVLRPGFVQIRVLDMEEALKHYRDSLGLDVVSTEEDGRVYLKAYDEFDRHSIVLREADSPGLDYMGWKVATDADLDRFAERLQKLNVEVQKIDAGEQPCVGRRVAFKLPTGHRFDLYATMEQSGDCPQTENPEVWQKEPRGMRIKRFDHCLLYGDDLEGTEKVLTEALEFSVSEEVQGPEGPEDAKIAVFLTCSNKAHDVAFVRHEEKGKFHHAAFQLDNWNDIGHAADILTRDDISLDIGPTRHGITRGHTIYFFDPSGNRNEVFAGGYDYYPDHPKRVWSADQVGKAIFYYDRALNERFLSVVT